MESRDHCIQSYLTTHRWALQRTVLDSLCAVIERHLSGEKLTEDQIRMIAAPVKSKEDPRKYELNPDGTAILHISGVVAKYSSMVNNISQPMGTSVEFLSSQLALAMSDTRVQSIFLRIESPGGTMSGLPDFADQVYQASFEKPIIAFADDQAASAAYWIGSQANAFFANQSAMVGSIGVYTVIPDSSKRAEMLGLKFNVISSGPIKGAGVPGSPVTEDHLAYYQSSVNEDFEMFLSAVKRGRAEHGLSDEGLRTIADGRQFSAAQAVHHKLIDQVMTLEAALMQTASVRVRHEGYSASSAVEHNNKNLNRKVTCMEANTEVSGTAADAGIDTAKCAADQERSRILAIQSVLAGGEFDTVRNKAIAEGWDVSRAKAEAFEVAQGCRAAEQKAAGEKLAAQQQRLDAIASSGHAEELAPQADTTPSHPIAGMAGGNADAFETAVTGYVNSGLSLAAAQRKASIENPVNHTAWIASKQKK